jgi:hypothetical protein
MPQSNNIERISLLLLAVATLLALVLADIPFALGTFVGGLLGVGNFAILRRLMAGIVASGSQPKKAMLSFILLFKFGLVGALIFVVMKYLPIDPVGLMIGVSTVVISIFVEGFRMVQRETAAQSTGE